MHFNFTRTCFTFFFYFFFTDTNRPAAATIQAADAILIILAIETMITMARHRRHHVDTIMMIVCQ